MKMLLLAVGVMALASCTQGDRAAAGGNHPQATPGSPSGNVSSAGGGTGLNSPAGTATGTGLSGGTGTPSSPAGLGGSPH